MTRAVAVFAILIFGGSQIFAGKGAYNKLSQRPAVVADLVQTEVQTEVQTQAQAEACVAQARLVAAHIDVFYMDPGVRYTTLSSDLEGIGGAAGLAAGGASGYFANREPKILRERRARFEAYLEKLSRQILSESPDKVERVKAFLSPGYGRSLAVSQLQTQLEQAEIMAGVLDNAGGDVKPALPSREIGEFRLLIQQELHKIRIHYRKVFGGPAAVIKEMDSFGSRRALLRSGATPGAMAGVLIGAGAGAMIGNGMSGTAIQAQCDWSLSDDQASLLKPYVAAGLSSKCRITPKGFHAFATMKTSDLKKLCEDVPQLRKIIDQAAVEHLSGVLEMPKIPELQVKCDGTRATSARFDVKGQPTELSFVRQDDEKILVNADFPSSTSGKKLHYSVPYSTKSDKYGIVQADSQLTTGLQTTDADALIATYRDLHKDKSVGEKWNPDRSQLIENLFLSQAAAAGASQKCLENGGASVVPKDGTTTTGKDGGK